MGDRFHRAARDGSTQKGLELLKEATSRDLNRYLCFIQGFEGKISSKNKLIWLKQTIIITFLIAFMHKNNPTFKVLQTFL